MTIPRRRRHDLPFALAACVVLFAQPGRGLAQQPLASNDQEAILQKVGFDQRLGETVPLDAEFADSQGRRVRLADVVGDRPVVLALVYHECPQLCNQVLAGLLKALKAVEFTAGDAFDVLIVSFDPRETPAMAAGRKEQYLRLYERENASGGFHFLTGERAAIDRLCRSVGFRYEYDRRSARYAHASGIVVLTPEGRISQYFYGIDYPVGDMRLALVDASRGEIGSAVDQVMLFCFHYDPTTGRYGLAIFRLLRLGGVLTAGALAGFIVVALRRERAKKTAAASPVAGFEHSPSERVFDT